MKKRIIALLLCLVLMASFLAGCGGDNSEGGTPTNNSSSTQNTPAGNGGEENKTPENNGDTPAVDTSEPITVSIFQQADDVTMDEVENNPVTLYWEKMFNIDIQWQFPPQGSEQEQLTMMLGTGDYTEVMNLSFSQENLPSLYQDGVIWELSPYLEQYAPNYYAYLNDPANADVRSILYDDDGHIYNMATVQEHPMAWGGFVYRRDILDTMTGGNIAFPSGNSEPTTIEDMDYMLGLMKQYFDNAGMAVSAPLIIPSVGYVSTGEFLNGFGIGALEYLDNGTVKFGLCEDKFYNYLVKMKEWFDKGYLYADFASRTQDMFFLPNTELTYGGAAGCWYGLTANLGGAMSIPDYGLFMDVQPMAAPADTANGVDTPLGILLDSGRTQANSGFAFSKACSEEKLIRLLSAFDWFFTEEGAITRTMGLSAEQGAADYKLYSEQGMTDGARKNGTREWTDFVQHEYTDDNVPNVDRMPGISIQMPPRDTQLVDGVSYEEIGDEVWTKYGNANTYPLTITLSPEDNTRATTLQTQITDYANSMIVKFIMGREELTPESFKAYQDQIHALGVDEYIALKQAAYDAFITR